MRKTSLIATILLLFGSSLFAQFEKGNNLISAGVGFTHGHTALLGNYEYALSDRIGIGGTLAYMTHKTGPYTKLTVTAFLGNFNYHFTLNNEKVDLYAGAGAGFGAKSERYLDTKEKLADTNESGIQLDVRTGCRYYFTEKFAAFGELGYGVGVIRLGATMKL